MGAERRPSEHQPMNTSDWTPPDEWLVLLENDGSTHIEVSEDGAIDAAVARYLESGCTRDELLHLSLAEGGTYRVRVSRINSWWICTPEHTYRNLLRDAARRETERATRAELGLPWKEEDE